MEPPVFRGWGTWSDHFTIRPFRLQMLINDPSLVPRIPKSCVHTLVGVS